MTRRRWIADEVSADNAALTGAHADHLIRALRARVGQEFDIVAGEKVRRARISQIADGRVEFELAEEIVPETTAARLTLLLSIFKFDRMEWAIEKATELGVARIIPVIARRTDSHLASAAAKRVERWRRIALQASEQSRRGTPPEIDAPSKLRDVAAVPAPLKIVLAESEQEVQLADVVSGSKDEIALAVGPEGGWTDDELQFFRKEDWISTSLGATILRAETAAIAAIAITMSELNR
jgi:16S rRNA (uracil1498-N3)-methyltransferase